MVDVSYLKSRIVVFDDLSKLLDQLDRYRIHISLRGEYPLKRRKKKKEEFRILKKIKK